MYIRAERKATGRRPEVGNGEQRPRCDGGKAKRSVVEGVCQSESDKCAAQNSTPKLGVVPAGGGGLSPARTASILQ